MTRVDFYVLDNPNEHQHGRLICRLADKAFKAGHSIFIRCDDADHLRSLDELLWTYKDTAFLPHTTLGTEDDLETPITLGTGASEPPTNEVLINLGPDVPGFFSRFERVMETSGSNESTRAKARERYRFYQDRGYQLATHKMESKRG